MKYADVYNLPENWRTEFEYLLLRAQDDKTLRKAYICSPCRADSTAGVYANMLAARFYMHYAFTNMRLYPYAPHATLPVILNDRVLCERNLALDFGKELLNAVDEMLVCGQNLSDGMRGEIIRAVELNIPVSVFSFYLYERIREITDSPQIRYDDKHLPLLFVAGDLSDSKEVSA